MTQRVIEITSPIFLPEDDIPATGIGSAFAVQRPLALEIGCGIGLRPRVTRRTEVRRGPR